LNTFGSAALYFEKKAIFSTIRECDLISNTLTSHVSPPIRGRPTLKDAERFRTGSIIHESKSTFGYVKTCINKCQKYTKSCQKYYTKSEQKCDKSTTEKTNNTQTNLQKTNVNSQSSCCTSVNEHMVNMAASGKNVSTYQCMSGINISNKCISKLNNQNIEITGLS
jgi:hypothetical protein